MVLAVLRFLKGLEVELGEVSMVVLVLDLTVMLGWMLGSILGSTPVLALTTGPVLDVLVALESGLELGMVGTMLEMMPMLHGKGECIGKREQKDKGGEM